MSNEIKQEQMREALAEIRKSAKPGMEVFRKTGHGFQKVKFLHDYAPEFPAVRVRTLDKAKHEWLVRPTDVVTAAEKQQLDEINYVTVRHGDVLQEVLKDRQQSMARIAAKLRCSPSTVSKVIKLGLKHKLITK